MNDSILHRIAINRTGQPLKQFARPARRDTGVILDGDLIAEKLGGQLTAADRNELENIPRVTVKKLVQVDLDKDFTFKVAKGEAENYIGAMRQVLSRVRRKAKKKKMRLDEFKMLLRGMVLDHPEYDEVTLVRTKTLSTYEESVLDELFNSMKKD